MEVELELTAYVLAAVIKTYSIIVWIGQRLFLSSLIPIIAKIKQANVATPCRIRKTVIKLFNQIQDNKEQAVEELLLLLHCLLTQAHNHQVRIFYCLPLQIRL